MGARARRETPPEKKDRVVLCAIYTRKSTDENLNTDFNSLDSQREYCESFIKSREPEGWRVCAEGYSDPGFTGGNMDRPGLKKLLADARQGKFNVVVCYKYDRLSRNTRDFLHILEAFDKQGIAFVSVTQPIDTTSSVGRLMRSILMDFSQFEREMISERTRDKLAAMARKGKRTGGQVILGYDLDRDKKAITVNQDEAKQVLEMFETYRRLRSLSATAKALDARGYRLKRWITKEGNPRGGGRINKATVFNLITNVLYIGRITHRGEEYPGEHAPIVPEAVFREIGAMLRKNGNGLVHRDGYQLKHDFILRGLLRCASCRSAMTPHSAYGRDKTPHFYYRCVSVNKMDKSACDVRSVPAKAVEAHVIRRLEMLGSNSKLVERVIRRAQEKSCLDLPIRREERRIQSLEFGRAEAGAKNLLAHLSQEAPDSPRRGRILAEFDGYMAKEEEGKVRLAKLDKEIAELEKRQIDAAVLQRNLLNFSRFYERMESADKRELIRLLLKGVTYDPGRSKLIIELNQLPDLWGDVSALEQRFVDRQKTLRRLDSNQ